MPGTALHVRTPDRLEWGMAVELIPGEIEIVRHTLEVNGRWMVRTFTNLHRCPAELLVPVRAWIGQRGFVTAEVA